MHQIPIPIRRKVGKVGEKVIMLRQETTPSGKIQQEVRMVGRVSHRERVTQNIRDGRGVRAPWERVL